VLATSAITALAQQGAERRCGEGIVRLCRLLEPLHCFDVLPLLPQQQAEVYSGIDVAARRGGPPERDRFARILCSDDEAEIDRGVHTPDGDCLSIQLFGTRWVDVMDGYSLSVDCLGCLSKGRHQSSHFDKTAESKTPY
jgi:hypothetical protein